MKTILLIMLSLSLLQAKENTTFVGNIVYWSLNQNMDTKYESIMRKCLTQRGHSILN